MPDRSQKIAFADMRDMGVRVRPDFNWNSADGVSMNELLTAQLTARLVGLLLTIGVPSTRGPISVKTRSAPKPCRRLTRSAP
jgi:hypothetical protein